MADDYLDPEEEATLDSLLAYLGEWEYDYEIDDDGDVTAGFDVDGQALDMVAIGAEGTLSLYLDLPVLVKEELRPKMAETIVRANHETTTAWFDMSFEDGAVRCRTRTLNPNGVIDSETIGGLLEDTLEIAAVYSRAFEAVLSGSKSPAEAVASAAAEVEALSEEEPEEKEDE